jgi:hypothetical protein
MWMGVLMDRLNTLCLDIVGNSFDMKDQHDMLEEAEAASHDNSIYKADIHNELARARITTRYADKDSRLWKTMGKRSISRKKGRRDGRKEGRKEGKGNLRTE